MSNKPSPTTKIITDFFNSLLDFDPDINLEVSDQEISIHVQLDQQLSSLVIGHHGEVLTAIQLILAIMLGQQSGEWKPVRLNINDYRQQRQASLENLARTTAEKVVARNQPLSINNLSSYERRIVHAALTDHPNVSTQSQGEPPHRHLVISPKQPQPKGAPPA